MKQNWQSILEPIIRQAGDILLSYYNKPLSHHEKVQGGFVTDADLTSEAFLIKQLMNVLPESSIWAEESGKKAGSSDYCWIIDPLDGTTNFVRGLPCFCVSVALAYKNIPFVGAIYQPVTNEFFYAQEGLGAFLDGKSIHVSSPKQFSQAVISIELPHGKKEQADLIHAATQKITLQAYATRHWGSIALNMAYVACGKMDAVVCTHLAWWDIAAGKVLIEEAGGVATDFLGKPLNPDYTTCIGGGKMVYNQIALLLSE